MTIRSIIIDNHYLFAEGLSALLEHAHHDIEVLGIVKDSSHLPQVLHHPHLDLVFLDLNLGTENGVELIPALKNKWPGVKILVVTMYDNQKYVKDAFVRGADGYVLKDSRLNDLEIAIEAVMKNDVHMGLGVSTGTPNTNGKNADHYSDRFDVKMRLTKREKEILQLISLAFSNKEIAAKLYISDQTVSVHRKSIMRKLGVSNTISLVKRAQELSLTD